MTRGLLDIRANFLLFYLATDRSVCAIVTLLNPSATPQGRGDPVISPYQPLLGKTAWITGASRGLGRAVAAGLAGAGAAVAITARSEADLRVLATELDESDVLVLPGSVTDSDAMTAAAGEIVRTRASLDVLVNMAGISPTVCRSEELSDDDWRRIVDVNLTGTFYCSRAAGRQMLRAEGGSIINVSSVHGSTGVSRMAAYGASKGGVENLTRSLAIEWAARLVRVNCLAPGYFRTQMTERYLESPFGQPVKAAIPMGRIGDAAELVGAAIFLASDASSYVTGAFLHVDGGWTAQ